VAILLIVSSGHGTQSGLVIILLIPVVWTALYRRPTESVVTVVAALAALALVSWIGEDGGTVIIRRVVLWAATCALITVSAYSIRRQLGMAGRRERERARQLDALMNASRELTAISDPSEVIDAGIHWAANLVSPPGSQYRRAQYLQVNDGWVTHANQYDEAGIRISDTYLLTEHRRLEEVVRTGEADTGPIVLSDLGPEARKIIERLGVSHGAWVPVRQHGALHGVLAVSSRGTTFTHDMLETCEALGSILELALGNALAQEHLIKLAATDALTGLPNRRGFDSFSASRPRSMSYAVLSLDVDGLKAVNDKHGHARGDVLLTTVAGVLGRVIRQGDILARMGGDEFAAFLYDAREEDGIRVADRMLHALSRTEIDGIHPAISIGIACGSGDGDVSSALRAGDLAMYEAKRSGGGRFALASDAGASSLSRAYVA
jgi:diguanylate cyclase (GGDEF)-like protein